MTHLRCAADAVDALEAAAVGTAAGSGAVADDIARRSASANGGLKIPLLFSTYKTKSEITRQVQTWYPALGLPVFFMELECPDEEVEEPVPPPSF